ncbi:ABC transporter permease [Laribacter hongkongensis]|uniref:ABC transporter permease n=1 Tax=Laribacter hongkongensis TaxID=168471 RepID=UPI001EFC5C7C|nr:ABC transporter permease subunit [Laribacter hongkongensis]MCG9054176.1 ABC transporter permease [Laribacter hongkongensis]MCG9083889.1 ABC transporter permease [Laribacter hongkongensis]
MDSAFLPLLTIASKECRDRIRNRWVLVVAVLFALFALVIAWFGPAQQGTVGFRGIEPTIASLTSLVIYLLPLIALILGFDAIVGERERGSLDLLMSMPVTRAELLLGKYLGLATALTAATVTGFGIAGLALLPFFDLYALWHYAGFVFSSLLLGLAFLSLSVLVSVCARDRSTASGLAIALWFLFVLVFDLLLLGTMVLTGGEGGAGIFVIALFLNPADVFRILNVFSSSELKAFYGLATVLPDTLTQPALLGSVMLAWIVVPLAVAVRRFKQS